MDDYDPARIAQLMMKKPGFEETPPESNPKPPESDAPEKKPRDKDHLGSAAA